MSAIKADRYIVNGEPAFCCERGGIVQVSYENGSYTAANVETFLRWMTWPRSEWPASLNIHHRDRNA